MNILHVIVGLHVGGAEMMLKRLIESRPHGAPQRHAVVSLTDLGPVGQMLRDAGVEVQTLGMRSLADSPRVLWRLTKMIRQRRPDIVQTWMYHADLLGGLAARLAGAGKVVWGIRTTDVDMGNTRSTAAVMRLCAALSRRVPAKIVCAAEAARKSHVSVGYDAAKMVVIPNGFACADQLPAGDPQANGLRRQWNIAADALVVGSVGRFNFAKDQANFVRAAGIAAARLPSLRCVMVGRGLDASNVELVSWIAATGHADRFILLGERSDVGNCLAAMDVFCLSSRSEGFPNVVGEAMAMAVPCVGTDVGDAALLIGETGVVVEKENSEALAEGLMKLLDLSPQARRQYGIAAWRRIDEEFSMARAYGRFEEIYEQLSGKRV